MTLPTPFYAHDGITIYHGDCRELLPELPMTDLLLTDPVWPNSPAGMFSAVEDAYELLAMALTTRHEPRLVIVLRHDSDPRFLQAVPLRWEFFRVQILPYVMPGYIGRKLGGDELAYCFGTPIPSAPGRRVIPGYAPKAQPGQRPNNGHPCSRALSHIKWLVSWWSLEGETILDPMAGSGTILVACSMGRNVIAVELEQTFVDIMNGNWLKTY